MSISKFEEKAKESGWGDKILDTNEKTEGILTYLAKNEPSLESVESIIMTTTIN